MDICPSADVHEGLQLLALTTSRRTPTKLDPDLADDNAAQVRHLMQRSEYAPVSQSTGLKWVVLTGLKAMPIALVAGALAFAAVMTLSAAGNTESAVTTARIGLTDEVNWPFFDPVIARTSQLASADELSATLQTQFGDTPFVISTDVPDQLAAIIDIVVEADDEQTAEAVAEAAATWIVENGNNERRAKLESVTVALAESIAALDTNLAESAVLADQAAAAVAVSTDPAVTESLRRQLRLTNDEIDAFQKTKLDLENELGATQRQLEVLAPETMIANVTTDVTTTGESLPMAVAVGIGAALVAILAFLIFQREHGRISSTDQLREVLGVDAGTFPAAPGTVPLAGMFRQLAKNRTSIVGVEHGSTNLGSAEDIAHELEMLGFSARVASSFTGNEFGDHPDEFSDRPDGGLGGDIRVVDFSLAEHAIAESMRCDHVLLVFDSRKDRMRTARARIRTMQELGVPVLGLLLVKRA